jgi:hypothetical protein
VSSASAAERTITFLPLVVLICQAMPNK